MVHLRIVVPSHRSEHVLELLENSPSACNLVFLERAARRPEGDVILVDVAREDASVIVSDLRELEVDKVGSIAREDIDSQISKAAERAERAAPGAPSDAVVWEEVESRTSENIELSASFLGIIRADELNFLAQRHIGPVHTLRIVTIIGADQLIESTLLVRVHILQRVVSTRHIRPMGGSRSKIGHGDGEDSSTAGILTSPGLTRGAAWRWPASIGKP